MDANLPDVQKLDREGLLALFLSQHQQLVETQQRLASRESEITHLKLLLAKLQRMQFWPALGKSAEADRTAGAPTGRDGSEQDSRKHES